jgi:hypothetical protein
MPFIAGETVGQYRIIKQLGQQGMATVFKANRPLLDRLVAVRAFHPASRQDPNFPACFQREVHVAAKLEHPNIVPIHDFDEFASRTYLVMKFIERETLKTRLERNPLPETEIVGIESHILEGILIIANLLANQPGYPEGRLVQAEMFTNQKDNTRARSALMDLQNAAKTPAWIRELAGHMLNNLYPRGEYA